MPATKAFAAAVEAGDVAKAKAAVRPARVPYEAIEPVAESFGDLDPRIDARVNDVEPGQKWTGFHRIEQRAVGRRATDRHRAAGHEAGGRRRRAAAQGRRPSSYQPAQLANGAVELLNEVSKSKITGEEERYSHTDLTDFEANVDGAAGGLRRCCGRPWSSATRRWPTTAGRAVRDALDRALAPYHREGRRVRELLASSTRPQRRKLSQAVDALAEPLSQVARQDRRRT